MQAQTRKPPRAQQSLKHLAEAARKVDWSYYLEGVRIMSAWQRHLGARPQAGTLDWRWSAKGAKIMADWQRHMKKRPRVR
jgi:hypothetical protein